MLNSKENFCPCAAKSTQNYDVFDYNLIQENYGGERVDKNPDGYITMGNTGSRYSASKEARGSPMGLPLDYDQGCPPNLPLATKQANLDSRIPYGENNTQFWGLGNIGNPGYSSSLKDKNGGYNSGGAHENFQYMARPHKFNSITPLPHNTPLWSMSYLSYLTKVPPTVQASIQDPNNKTSYVIPGMLFGKRN